MADPAPVDGALPPALERALARISLAAHLSPALAERLRDLALGLSNAQIAARHDVSVNTVKTEVTHVLAALGVDSRTAISSAVEAAARRALAGASEEALVHFLRLRFE
jgi:DNA-binding NarL/FixJ family response regulator